jgi:hypothetical protein
MKSILTILFASLTICPFLSAQMLTDRFKFTDPIELPHVSMRDMLELVATWSGKRVVVASENDLNPTISLVLPAPVSGKTVRKVIDALLLLEGFELIDSGDKEIQLHRVLTPEQCDALNKGIGHIREAPGAKPTRGRVAVDPQGAVTPASELVVIRPAIQREVEQPGAAQPATQPADKVPSKNQPSTPTSEDAPR